MRFKNYLKNRNTQSNTTKHGLPLRTVDAYSSNYKPIQLWTSSVAVGVAKSIRGTDVIRILEEAIQIRGKPKQIQSDNGSEFTSNAVLGWVHQTGIEWKYIEPGKPVQNSHIESFSGKIRDECLNENWFETLSIATEIIADYPEYELDVHINRCDFPQPIPDIGERAFRRRE